MNKKILALALALVLALSLAACGGGSSNNSSDDASGNAAADAANNDADSSDAAPEITATLRVAASPTPHAEVLAQCVDILKEQGIELIVNEYSDYVMPNIAVEDGDEDANYFQHVPYLDDFNAERDTHLVSVASVHIEPMGLYAGKSASLDAIPDGGSVAVPNDSTNEGRALLLLEAQGLIKLKDSSNLNATPNDIEENPKNLTFVELEAANVPANLDEVDVAVINSNYALGAGLNPVEDALVIEAVDSPYVNILVVREGNENNEAVQALVKALQSDTVRDFINSTYDGAVVPAF